jgi:hypothetical protein
MFEFFKPKPNEAEAMTIVEKLANTAIIEAVLEKGRYSGMLIRVDQSGQSLGGYLAHEAARDVFIEILECRIKDGEFDPPPSYQAELGFPAEVDDGRDSAVRVLLGPDNSKLLQWNRQI